MQARAALLVALLFSLVAGCLDEDDYGECLARVDSSNRYFEYCTQRHDAEGVCPEPEVGEVNVVEGCWDLKDVVCGPQSMFPTGADGCCYVLRIDPKAQCD